MGEAYLAAFAARGESAGIQAGLAAAPVAVGWSPLGPFSVPHGQTYGSGPLSRPSVSGRIGAIAVDPSNPQHILAGSAGGGVWETRDLGATWSPRTDNQPSLATGAIAFDPQNPSIVYAGTGEGDFYANLGAGLLRLSFSGPSAPVARLTRFPCLRQFEFRFEFADALLGFQISRHGLSNVLLWAFLHGGLSYRSPGIDPCTAIRELLVVLFTE